MNLKTKRIIQTVLVATISGAIFIWWLTDLSGKIKETSTDPLKESIEQEGNNFIEILEEGRELLSTTTAEFQAPTSTES